MTRFLLLLVLLLPGCQNTLMPTPNIYVGERYDLYPGGLPPELETTTIDLLYVTDRAPERKADGSLRYGWKRSRSVAFGSCMVELGRGLDWETLRAKSATGRSKGLPVTVRAITELGRAPETPIQLIRDEDGRFVPDPDDDVTREAVAEAFREEVRRRLDQVAEKRVVIYIHGYNNTFDYAAAVMAEYYHWVRNSVPLLYSWPAGSPGLLQGYTHDRESGEFTVYHLKQLLQMLGTMPEIEGIDIVAHSRGTHVATTALRELELELRGSGRHVTDVIKLDHLVLASPDLDFEVMLQRFVSERMHSVARRMTLYVSAKDEALGIAEWLLRSDTRLGKVRPEDFDESDRAILESIDIVDIIDCRVKTGSYGHAYFHSSPAVSSDLLLGMIYGFEAGSPQRPLEEVFPGYWVLDEESYPFVDE